MTAPYTVESTRTDVLVTGRRIVATLIDVVILGAAYALVAAGTGSIHTAGPWNWVADTSPITSVLYALTVAAYFIFMEVRFGQTLGKMLTGISVIDERTGATPDFGPASIRTVLRLVDGLAGYLVAYVAVLTSGRRQRLGDMAAHTLVVRMTPGAKQTPLSPLKRPPDPTCRRSVQQSPFQGKSARLGITFTGEAS